MKHSNVRTVPLAFLALALLTAPTLLQAQTGNVTGLITDAGTLAPLEAVQVSIVGQGIGVTTNAQGRYLIQGVPVGEVTIQVERLGYTTQTAQATVSSDAAAVADFQLASEALLLEEVVVTALGITRAERSLGYSVQGIDGDELAEIRDTNIISNLAGKVAGLVVTPPAVLGGTSKMVLRGIASISGNNEPLIVVDGVPIDNSRRETAANGGSRGSVVRNRSGIDYGNMAQDLDPSNVESVTVLRGANAAALYGSRASNGVVEIVTKSGRGAIGGTTITASSNFVVESPLRLVKYQNVYGGGATDDGYNWVDGRGGGENDGVDESWGPPLDGRLFPQWWSNGVAQPWLPSPMNVREYFQTGHNLTTNFAISNATERSNVRFSALRMDATGMAPQNEAERTQLALNAGVQVTDRFNIDGSFQYTQTQGHNRPSPGNGSYSAIHIFNWFQRQVDAKRMERATNEWDPASGVLTPNWNHNYHDNVYWLQFFRNNDDRRNRVIGQVTGNYEFADWLNARVRLGTDWFEQSNKEVYPFYSQDTPEGGFVEAASFRQETNLEALVTANRQLTTDLSLNVSGGANMRRNDFDLQEAGSRKLNVPDIYNVSNSAAPPLLNYIVQKKAVNSLYGLFTVGYREFAFIDVTARNDWSSTLPETSRSYFYPSFSGSLVFTDALRIDSDFLSYGKLRASWAKVGNDADPYQLTSVYSEVDKFGNIPGFTTSNTIPNANLRPEETRSWEIGTDLRFFFDRAALDLTYYNSTTRDQILAVDVSESSGYTRQVLNAGSVRNKGIEALLTVDLLNQPGGVAWDMSLNFGANDSEVLELAPGLESIVIGRAGGIRGAVEARPGHPYGVFFGPTWKRDGAGNIIVGDNGLPIRGSSEVIGSYQPDWIGGIRSTLGYGSFTFSAQVDTHRGGQIFCGSCRLGYRTGVLYESANPTPRDWDPDRATGRGPVVFPGVTEGGSANTVAVAPRTLATRLDDVDTEWLFDNNFTKLREVAIAFDLPPQVLEALPVSQARITLVGRNLWLWTAVPHIDPETAAIEGSTSEANLAGIEYEQYPTPRTFGINISVVH